MFEPVKQNNSHDVQRKSGNFFQAKPVGEQAFFSPAPSLIQREDNKSAPGDATKTLTEGVSVVKEQLDDKPGYKEWQDQQTDALKKKVWDDQPTELKAGIITFGLSSAGILGTVVGLDPAFRANTIKFLDDKNLALPLSLIPHHEYFPLSSFKYKLPSATQSPINFDTEFDLGPYMDLVHNKWSFIPKTGLTVDLTSNYSEKGGFNVTGGSIKLKLGGGIVNLSGFVNSTLPPTPMLIQGNNPGESPVWMMRSLPGQSEDQLPKGSGVFLTVDVMRLPQLWHPEEKGRDTSPATSQPGEVIRRMPKDPFGRPLGFVPTAEQEAYDLESYEIREWEKVLARLGKGELDDRDLANWRLRNRLTGLTTTEINDLLAKIKDYQTKNPGLSTTRITEWLEVRKEISTPMPDGAVVNKDPITNTIQSYSLTINNVKVTVVTDTFGSAQNATGPVTSFGRSYSWHSNNKNIIDRLTNTDNGNVPINPTSFEVTIQTSYHDSPNDQSGYGKGTDVYDKEEKTTTLRVHEGKHGTDFIDYIRKNPFPADISKGIVGVLTLAEMRKIDSYISGITKESCEATDQVGFTQDEFLKTAEGKLSGIKSCRTQ